MKRIHSIDVIRGLVMIIMALDHVRDLLYTDSITQSPTNLATTTPLLFFTRWITYLCAPAFVFLAGASAYLSFRKNKDIRQSRNFLFKRGLWLILLEFTVLNFGLFGDPGFHTLLFEVIAAIGVGFILLGFLLRCSPAILGITGLVIIFCHNLIPLLPLPENSLVKTIGMPFFSPGAFPLYKGTVFIMGYPPIPWTGILLLGFAAGKYFEIPAATRKKLFLKTGMVALFLFILLRFINIYGDPVPWSLQQNSLYSLLSFMNVSKYPPSLQFCLITLGILFILLALAEHLPGKIPERVATYGRVPLFYFLVHFYLIHAILLVLLLLQGFSFGQMDFHSGSFGRPPGVKSGVGLGAVYLIWIAVVVILYKPCSWFGRFKATHNNWWLKYS